MKIEEYSSMTNLVQTPELPDDFARGVIVKARAVRRHRQIRQRLAAGVTVILLAAIIPLANRISSRTENLSAFSSPTMNGTLVSYRQDTDQTDALRLAEAVNPDAVGDYLMPNTSTLAQFADTYSDASWDADSDWTAGSDASTGS
jgi:hypothetical protein